MKKYILFFVVIFFTASCAYAALDKPLVDPEFKKIDEKIQRKEDACFTKLKESKSVSFYALKDCMGSMEKELREEGKIRGTQEYCEFHYNKLSFDELIKLKKKFKSQQKTARDSYCVFYDDDRLPGEVTKQDLQTEMGWIQDKVANIHRKRMDDLERSLYQTQSASPAQSGVR